MGPCLKTTVIKIALFLSLATSSVTVAHAQHYPEVKVRSWDHESILRLPGSCARLDAIKESLIAWRKRLGEKAPAKLPTCRCENGDDGKKECELDVTTLVPGRIAPLLGHFSIRSGPNCLNAAMFANGQVDQAYYMTGGEFEFLLSKACRKKSPGEKPAPGDTVAFFTPKSAKGRSVYHAFIYISDDIAFTKNGYSTVTPFILAPYRTIAEDYHQFSACLPTQKNPNPTGWAGCDDVAIFDCTGTPEWFASQTCDPAHLYIQNKVDSLSCVASGYAMKGSKPMTPEEFGEMNELLDALKTVSDRRVNDPKKSERDKTFWESVKQRSNSIYEQFH